jgi:enamine deaminase RidA (YjgF/YER057c/UK114 family)
LRREARATTSSRSPPTTSTCRQHIDDVLKKHREFVTKQPYPAWSALGVTELYQPASVLEVSVIVRVST